MIRITQILICLLTFGLNSYGQTHQWAQPLNSNSYAHSSAVSLDSNHNSYVVGSFKDSLYLGGKFISSFAKANYNDVYIAKFNPNGKLGWCKTIYCKRPRNSAYALFLNNVRVISNNRIMIYGFFNQTEVLMLGPNDSILNYRAFSNIGFIAYYDSSGNVVEHHKVYKGNFVHQTELNGLIDIDQQNNIYLSCIMADGMIYSKTDSIKVYPNSNIFAPVPIIIKYGPDFNSTLWYKDVSDSSNSNNLTGSFNLVRIRVGADNNLYLASYLRGSNLSINKVKYNFSKYFCKGLLIVLSPKGKVIHSGLINEDTTQQDNIIDVAAIDTNRIYVMGYVEDSILRNGKWYRSANPASKGKAYPYVGLINTSYGAKWINLTRNKDSFMFYTYAYFYGISEGRLNFDKAGNLYSSFRHYYNPLSIGGLTDTNTSRNLAGFVKFDSLGNALWLRSTGKVTDMQADGKNLVYCGGYSNTLKLNPFTLKYSSVNSGFVAKTYDYFINRGNVYKGPYCAGDTIRVPYVKNGDFDTSNFFVAEISDENGNFEGKEKELGRLKTNNDSIIYGRLPNFQTVTSGKYRIRIRSTNPVVQSFYKFDILRLLIYSRDKANPGSPETICNGDTIQLNTYGGSKWIWSPKYRMNDSTQRQPLVWPQFTTTYKIIIADSSGCGAPDTAYKLIVVKKPLNANLEFTDTAVCDNTAMKIRVKFEGGDSANYQWKWYYVFHAKSWFSMRSGSLKQNDTLDYYPTVDLNTSEKLAIVLKDNCTNKSDTAFINISFQKPAAISPQFKDTVLCNGINISWKAKATGSNPAKYIWEWKDLTHNGILSTKDSLSLKATQTAKIQLILKNGCLSDTNTFNLYVNPPLKGAILYNKGILHDTTLCYGKSLKLFSTGKGGTGSGYKFNWYLDKTLISTGDTLSLKSDVLYLNTTSTKTLKLVLKDNCTSGSDSISRNIKVIPGPQSDFSWGIACNKTKVPFTFTGNLAVSPVTTKYSWHFPDGDSSIVQNPSKLLSQIGKNTVTLTLKSSNGCNDAISIEVDVKQQSKANFTANDVCEDSTVNFINTSKDGINYDWKFGDGKTSNLQSPKHLYQIAGQSTTFNVSMVAIVPNGCSDSITKAVTVNANPKPDFNFTISSNQVIFTAIETNASNYHWDFGDGGMTNTSNQKTTYSYIKFQSGKYNACLKVSNIAGCVAESCKEVNISGAANPLIKQNGFKIYPNPNQGSFTVEISEPKGNLTIEIYDAIGQMVHKVESFQSLTVLNLNLAEGIYMVRVINGGEVYRERVLVGR